ncbi:MAG: HAMP domain-containing histidine kinase [Actinomycetota bacterium]|nr:HAMP domain-containing histidine kinase [Actinomycetota bacterium]
MTSAAGPGPLRALVRRLSLASRVALLSAVAVGVAVAVTSAAAFATVRMQLYDSLDDSLRQRAHAAASSDLVQRATLEGVPSAALGAGDVLIALVAADGSSATARGTRFPQLGPPEVAVARSGDTVSVRTVATEAGDYRVVAVPSPNADVALVLAQSLEPTHATLRGLGTVMLLVGAAGVLLAAMAGAAVARSGLRPVRRLTGAAEDVARTDQLRPIEVSGTDEIARLATAFNEMLAALAASRDRQRRLVADAGHELRTPLTSLRTNLDLLVQADARGGLAPQARQELLDDVRAQLAELTALVHDLIELARDEPLARDPVPVDLADVVARAVQRVRRRAGSVEFVVQVAPWRVVGEPQALERAVVNLLDNAVKWSPPGGVVHVQLAEGVLSVADRGPGVDEADLPYIFERFYRASDARRLPGSGLGLAITRQVAERHGGSVDAARRPGGGAVFRMAVPAAAGLGQPPASSQRDLRVTGHHR